MTEHHRVEVSVVTGAANVRVLVVDDTPALRMLTRLMLEDSGFEVVGEAGDGLAGVTLATELQPDLVLLDLAMPVMDGLEALPKVREVAPGARVVVVSGFEHRAMAAQVMDAGADAYVEKGLPPDEVVAELRKLFPRAGSDPFVAPEPRRALSSAPDPEPVEALRIAGYDLVEPVRVVRAVAARISAEARTPEEQETGRQLSEAAERLQRVLAEILEAEQG